MNKNTHRGSNFDDFRTEEGILEELEIKAAKRAVALQLEKKVKFQRLADLSSQCFRWEER